MCVSEEEREGGERGGMSGVDKESGGVKTTTRRRTRSEHGGDDGVDVERVSRGRGGKGGGERARGAGKREEVEEEMENGENGGSATDQRGGDARALEKKEETGDGNGDAGDNTQGVGGVKDMSRSSGGGGVAAAAAAAAACLGTYGHMLTAGEDSVSGEDDLLQSIQELVDGSGSGEKDTAAATEEILHIQVRFEMHT